MSQLGGFSSSSTGQWLNEMGNFLHCSEHLGVQSLERKQTSVLSVTVTLPIPSNCVCDGSGDRTGSSGCASHTITELQPSRRLPSISNSLPGPRRFRPSDVFVKISLNSFSPYIPFPEPEISTLEYISPHLLGYSFTGSQLLADSSKRSLVQVPQAAVQSCNGCLTLQLSRGFVSADTSQVPLPLCKLLFILPPPPKSAVNVL